MGTLSRKLLTPTYPCRNWTHGDSLTDLLGVQSDGIAPWTSRLPFNKHTNNLAKGGFRMDTCIDEMFPNNPTTTWTPSYVRPSGCRFTNAITWGPKPERLFLFAGVNDIIQAGISPGAGPSGSYGRLQDMFDIAFSAATTVGIPLYVFTIPTLPENGPAANTTLWNWDSDFTNFPLGFRPTFNQWLLSTYGDADTGGHVINLEVVLGGVNASAFTGTTGGGLGFPGPTNARPIAYVRLNNDFIHLSPAGSQVVADKAAPFILPDY